MPEAPLPEGALRHFGFQPREPARAKQPARVVGGPEEGVFIGVLLPAVQKVRG